MKRNKREKESTAIPVRIVFFIMILLLICGAGLRFWNLGTPSLWVDEANTVYSARGIVEQGKPIMPSGMDYRRGELYIGMVSLVYRVFGDSEAATRLISGLFGVLTIVMVFFLGQRIFQTEAGLMAAFLQTFSHFAVGWSRTARPYALLQFLTVLIVYAFVRGFEAEMSEERLSSMWKKRFSERTGISPLWLLICVLLIPVTFYFVHRLFILVPAGLLVYIVFRAVSGPVSGRRRINKYMIAALLSVAGVLALWWLFPSFKEATRYLLTYIPPWAVDANGAVNRFSLFNFLILAIRFPLAFLFVLGSIQMITRKGREGWILLCAFTVPMFMLSFIFQYRVPMYIFNIYPFFLILAAYGFVNLLRGESVAIEKVRITGSRTVKAVGVILLAGVFLISPWLRITLNIPFQEDGHTNLAVTHNEWREAAEIIRADLDPEDVIIASLPLIMRYYGLDADYNLNWANLARAKMNESVDSSGTYLEVYAGTPCIESLGSLHAITGRGRGWIIVSDFQLTEPNHIPGEVRAFLETLDRTETKNGSVHIYQWGGE
jgi:4-amino-4-deoxy-L-arabinose transferase-like glycosyltransferase